MSWLNQTREYITFLSPEDNVFVALWKNNERSVEKKLGIFDPPKFKGSIIQDLDVKSVSYPLTIYFDGPSHYDTANKFFKACQDEKGQWEVTHPTKGGLILQLVSVKELINPIDDGNFTVFETNWLEPANIERLVSPDELANSVLLKTLNAISDGITQIQQLRSDLYSAIQAAANMINTIANLAKNAFSEIAATEQIVNDAWQSAQSSVTALLAIFQADASDTDNQANVSNALSDVVTLPLETNDDYSSRNSFYSDYTDSLLAAAPLGNTIEDFNKVIFMEFSIITILVSMCRIIVTSTFKTRSEIIIAMDNLTVRFNDTINALETIQENFEGLDIDLQYFSQSQTWTTIQNLFSLTMQYLLTQFFNSNVEKILTLKNARSPIEITVTEYTDGDFETNYDLFLNSNDLHGNDILLLPAGREIKIYVNPA